MGSRPCRSDRHNYQAIPATIAGLGRRNCTNCGAVQIDLRSSDPGGTPALIAAHRDQTVREVFARRPTLFSLRLDVLPDEPEPVSAGFGGRGRPRWGTPRT
ncbi:MAG: hypothetical protein ACRDWH_00695 [Acidimicrobiia bacterium]